MDWNVLIGAAAGVLGAVAGGGALLRVNRNDRTDRRTAEHSEALVALYAAVNRLGMLYSTWSDIQPERDNPLTRLRLGIQISGYSKLLIERLWAVTDDVWLASGRARAVATGAEREVIDRVETLLGNWQFGEPLPALWGPAVRSLRALIEGTLPSAGDTAALTAEEAGQEKTQSLTASASADA